MELRRHAGALLFGMVLVMAAVATLSLVQKSSGESPSTGPAPSQLTCVAYSHFPIPRDATSIDPLTGLLQSKCVDLRIEAGRVILELARAWDPEPEIPGLVEGRWKFNWERMAVRSGELACIRHFEGTKILRRVGKTETYRSPGGDELVFSASGCKWFKSDGTKEIFDAQGRLIEVDARNGNLIRLSYESDGSLKRIAGPFGSSIEILVDERGRITQANSSTGEIVQYRFSSDSTSDKKAGKQIQYRYQNAGRLTSIVHPRSGSVEFSYDQYGRVMTRRFADGSTERFEYDDVQHSVRRTDPAGRVFTTRVAADGSTVEYNTGNRRSLVAYDQSRRPAAFVGPTGLAGSLTYDEHGRPTKVDNPESGTTSLEYRANSHEVAVLTSADGRRMLFEQDGEGNLLSTKYEGDSQPEVDIEYLPNGLPERVRSRNGEEVHYAYDDHGRMTSITDKAGRRGTFEHDAAGRLTRYVDPTGKSTTRKYDSEGRLASLINSNGAATLYEYNESGLVSKSIDALKGATSFEYDKRGRLIARTDPLMRITRFAYHADGRLKSRTDPAGATTRFEYDAEGRRASLFNPLEARTAVSYNVLGKATSLEEATGCVMRAAYDHLGRIAEQSNFSGNTTRFEYDKLGRVIAEIDEYGRTTRFQYDSRGNLVSSTNSTGRAIVGKYDAADRLLEVTEDSHLRAACEYDTVGNLISTKTGSGFKTTYKRDAHGRVLEWKDSLGGGGKAVYDREGLPLEFTDLAGTARRYRYDALGRVIELSNALKQAQSRKYDAAGQLIAATEANGDIARYEYDSVGRVTAVHLPAGGAKTYQYDALGNVIRGSDAIENAASSEFDASGRMLNTTDALGRKTSMTYDKAGRVVQKQKSDGSIVYYHYDLRGRISEIDDGAFPVLYTYDLQGRRTGIEYPAIKRKISYEYDSRDRVTSISAGDQKIQYEYDEFSRLATINSAAGSIKLGYDARNRRTSIAYPNGVQGTRQYNAAGRVSGVLYKGRDGKYVAWDTYAYDLAGNETGTNSASGESASFRYDAAGQLIEENRGKAGRTVYAYAPGGNRARLETADRRVDSHYNKADQLLKAGQESFTYDKVGNLVKRSGPRGVTSYSYNADNQLTKVTLADGKQVNYGYSPTGERIWREFAGVRTWYLGDGVHVLAELDRNFKTQAAFVHGPGIDEVLAITRGAKAYFAHADRRGSVRSLTDRDSRLAATYKYNAFGQITGRAGQVTCPFTFTGRELDDATGLYYVRARWYDPALGRFITKDPDPGKLIHPLSLNAYAYVTNNPNRFNDPYGADGSEPDLGKFPAASYKPRIGNFDGTLETFIQGAEARLARANQAYQEATARGITEGQERWFKEWIADEQIDLDLYHDEMGRRANGIRAIDQVFENLRQYETDPAGYKAQYQQAQSRSMDFDINKKWLDNPKMELMKVRMADGTMKEMLRDGSLRDIPKPEPATPPAPPEPPPSSGNGPGGNNPSPRPPQGPTRKMPISPPTEVAAVEGEGLWSRLNSTMTGAWESFTKPTVSARNVTSGVMGGSLVAGNMIIDMWGDGMTLGQSLKHQAKGFVVGLPLMLAAMATGTGEVLLVVGGVMTIKRAFDSLSGEATFQSGDPKHKKLLLEMMKGGQIKSTLSGNTPDPVIDPAQLVKPRPATPLETVNILNYLEGLPAPTALLPVPSVEGLDPGSAKGAIASAQFYPSVQMLNKLPANIKPMIVILQEPKAGTMLPAGSAVNAYYGMGKPKEKTVRVPGILRMTKSEAEAEIASLEQDGVKVTLSARGTAGDRKPTRANRRQEVYSQSPAEGTEVSEGDTVNFEYFAGLRVDNYIGLEREEAARRITRDDFSPQIDEGDTISKSPADRFKIVKQDPPAGAFVWFGDPVSAWYSKLEQGFLEGDGQLVHASVAGAEVSDRRMTISISQGGGGGKETNATMGWTIKRYPDAAGPKAAIAAIAPAMNVNPPPGATGFRVIDRRMGAGSAFAIIEINTSRNQGTAHWNMLIYRNVFLINYGKVVPRAGGTFPESATIIRKSKELIDLRFPND